MVINFKRTVVHKVKRWQKQGKALGQLDTVVNGGELKTEAHYPPNTTATESDQENMIVENMNTGHVTFNQKRDFLLQLLSQMSEVL